MRCGVSERVGVCGFLTRTPRPMVSLTETVALGEERGDSNPSGASCWSGWEGPLGMTPGTILTETQWVESLGFMPH